MDTKFVRTTSTVLGSALVIAAVAVATLASCTPAAHTIPVPLTTPIVLPPANPETIVQLIYVALPAASAGATPVPVALPTAAGFAPTMFLPLPQTATNTLLTVGVSNVAFSFLPPLSLKRFVVHRAALPTDAAVLLYLVIYSNTTLVLPDAPAFTIVIPSANVFPDANYYLAFYDPSRPSLGWQYGFEGPGTVSGTTVTFASNLSPFMFHEEVSYYFALFVIPQNSAQPTPAPSTAPTSVPTQTPPPVTTSPTPSPTPGGGVIVIIIPTPSPVLCTPSPVDVAVGATVQMACSANEYSGPFTLTIADPTIASVHQVTEQQYTSFDVTGLAAGTTTLSLQTRSGGSGSVTITVFP